MPNIVDEVTAESMDGKNNLEKSLNCYITSFYIGKKDLPSDECIREARRVITIAEKHKDPLKGISDYLYVCFYPLGKELAKSCAEECLHIIRDDVILMEASNTGVIEDTPYIGEKCICGHRNQKAGWSMEYNSGIHTYLEHVGKCYEPDCRQCATKMRGKS